MKTEPRETNQTTGSAPVTEPCCGGASCGGGGPDSAEAVPRNAEELVGRVRERYGNLAETAPSRTDLDLGCGAPLRHLAPRPGETVLDLGSGAGLDAFLAARAVGLRGKVIGVDMTPEMLRRARAHAEKAGLPGVEFREGRLESLPVDDASVDAVTSNCVINLVPDKARVFREIARVLKPGGRLVISDIVLDGELPPAVRDDLLAYVGCVAGALPRDEYFASIRAAGLADLEVLADVDFLAALSEAAPNEAAAFLAKHEIDPDALAGKVRSVTFRATRGA